LWGRLLSNLKKIPHAFLEMKNTERRTDRQQWFSLYTFISSRSCKQCIQLTERWNIQFNNTKNKGL